MSSYGYMKIKDLNPNPKNPRTITDAKLSQLKKAIKEFGDLSGIVYNTKSKQIVCGHQRLKSLDSDTPVVYTNKYSKPSKTGTIADGYIEIGKERFSYREVYWDENREKAANIAANKNAGSWDVEILSEWFEDLSQFDLDFDMSLTMFDDSELETFKVTTVKEHTRVNAKTNTDEDEVPDLEAATEPQTKLGDIYQLGQHRLMCGDSKDVLAVEKLLDGYEAEMLLTDPPYGMSVVKNNSNIGEVRKGSVGWGAGIIAGKSKLHKAKVGVYRSIIGDDKPFDPSFLLTYCESQIIFGVNHFSALLPTSPHWIIWEKGMPEGTNFSDAEIAWTNIDKKAVKVFKHVWAGMTREGSKKEELAQRVHPTQKPVGLFEKILEEYNPQSVLDLFGGSGSTLIACEKTHRTCYMMEIDPHYCDVIVKRWEDYTGEKAELLPRPKTKLKKADEQAESQVFE